MISFYRRVSDCEELESDDKLEGAEESDIVKICMHVACSVLGMAGALKDACEEMTIKHIVA